MPLDARILTCSSFSRFETHRPTKMLSLRIQKGTEWVILTSELPAVAVLMKLGVPGAS